ncbi:MAG: hypothetical protein JWO46_1892 [Nocardioidaceae bacterium]|nr:hypothetical protein [Nocardioidaceae bacterium]
MTSPHPRTGPVRTGVDVADTFCLATVTTQRDLPRARVLLDSARAVHPRLDVSVLVLQDPRLPLPTLDGAHVLGMADLGLEPGLIRGLAYGVPTGELVAALPFLLVRHLVGTGGHEQVLFLDQDVVVLRSLSGLAEAARTAPLAAVPRRHGPLPDDGSSPTTSDLLQHGLLDPGCFAATSSGEAGAALDWLCEAAVDEALTDQPHPQQLLDRAAMLLPTVAPITDPGWNVSFWNLPGRPLTRSDDGLVEIEGTPVVFLHLIGHDPDVPHLLSDSQDPVAPRVRLSRDPVLRDVCWKHDDALRAAGWDESRKAPAEAYATLGDLAVDTHVRELVRREVLSQRDTDHAWGTSRLDLAGLTETTFLGWAGAPSGDLRDPPGLGRYLSRLYASRPDLRQHIPQVAEGDLLDYLGWVVTQGAESAAVPPAVVKQAKRQRRAILSPRDAGSARRLAAGVEVVGYLSAELGIGEAGRMLVAGLEAGGTPVSTTTYTRTNSRLRADWVDRPAPDGAAYDVAVVCINAAALQTYLDADGGAEHLAGRYVVGLWFWELDDFPEAYHPLFDRIDEVWVTSEFTAQMLRRSTDKPVCVVPLPVHASAAPDAAAATKARETDAGFTFGFVFDYFSVLERKNPAAVVTAFTQAFPETGEARLVIKSVNSAHRGADHERFLLGVPDRPDVVVIDHYLARDDLDRLMHEIDCFVSLHRSEGFGLTMAEEMAIGKPTIATGYSGNLQFMSDDNSILVPYELVAVPAGNEPYPVTSAWADPDVAFAARAMRNVWSDPELRHRLGQAARESIARDQSTTAMAEFARERLDAIRSSLRHPDPPEQSPRAPVHKDGPALSGIRSLARRLRSS